MEGRLRYSILSIPFFLFPTSSSKNGPNVLLIGVHHCSTRQSFPRGVPVPGTDSLIVPRTKIVIRAILEENILSTWARVRTYVERTTRENVQEFSKKSTRLKEIVFAVLLWLVGNKSPLLEDISGMIQSSLTFSRHCCLLKSCPEFRPAFESSWIVCAAAHRRFIRTTITWIVEREASLECLSNQFSAKYPARYSIQLLTDGKIRFSGCFVEHLLFSIRAISYRE